MSKIVIAANVMVSNASKISNVIKGPEGDEYFFLYDNKYKWSILPVKGIFTPTKESYNLFYYPGSVPLKELASRSLHEWDKYEDFVIYKSEDLKTREAYETFSELYRMVKEKFLGVSDVLDDIIGDGIP